MSQIATIDRTRLGARIGALNAARMREVLAGLAEVLGLGLDVLFQP